MKNDVLSTLNEFIEAAENDSYSKLLSLNKELVSDYRDIEDELRFRIRQTESALYLVEGIADKNDILTEYYSTAVATELARGSLVGAVALDSSQIENADLSKIKEGGEKVLIAEEELDDMYQDVVEIIRGLVIPPNISVLSVDKPGTPVPKGMSVDIGFNLGNVGNKPIESEIKVKQDENLIHSENIAVKSTEQKSSSFNITPDREGEIPFAVQLFDDNRLEDSHRFELEVLKKKSYVNRINEYLEFLKRKLRDVNNKSRVEKIRRVQQKLQDSIRFIEKDQEKQANNMIDSGINILLTLQNEVDHVSQNNGKSKNNKELSEAVSASVSSSINELIGLMEKVIQADI